MIYDQKANHHIFLYDKKQLELKGIKKIERFDEQEFLMESVMGWILIKGKQLSLGKLDNIKQEVLIQGEVDMIQYVNYKEKANWLSKMLK